MMGLGGPTSPEVSASHATTPRLHSPPSSGKACGDAEKAQLAFREGAVTVVQHTLSIVKPDAVEKGLAGAILARLEKAGLKIVGAKMLWLSRPKAADFYAVHKGKPFFDKLVDFMVSGPILVSVLEGEGAIAKYRELMGATDPAKAAPGTLRKDYATNIERNAVHGSDSPETAETEIAHFFSVLELCRYERR
jgi:nucleoside-diphosphate kinase